MKGTSKKEKIISYVKSNPNKTAAQVAKALGVRQKYVYVTKSAAGLTKPKQKPINNAMKHAITDALMKASGKKSKATKQKVVGTKSMKVSLQIEMTEGTLTMSMAEAKELYGLLKPMMEK